MPDSFPTFRSLREFTAWLQLAGVVDTPEAAAEVTRLAQRSLHLFEKEEANENS